MKRKLSATGQRIAASNIQQEMAVSVLSTNINIRPFQFVLSFRASNFAIVLNVTRASKLPNATRATKYKFAATDCTIYALIDDILVKGRRNEKKKKNRTIVEGDRS